MKCIKRFVLNVGTNVKFRLSRIRVDPYTAENVGLRKEGRVAEEDTKHRILYNHKLVFLTISNAQLFSRFYFPLAG